MAGQNRLHIFLRYLIRPAIKFCYSRALSLNDLIEVAKHVFIEVAIEDMNREGHKINLSRISASTGVHRKDVSRIHKYDQSLEPSPKFGSRVMEAWRREKEYLTSSGRPRVLSYRGEVSEFTKLVYSLTKDVHPASVIFDLERVGAVERTSRGLKLVAHSYQSKDAEESYMLLAEDVEDLMSAVIENIETESQPLPNYHAKVFYDNLDLSALPKINKWIFDQSLQFQAKIAKYLSQYDLDVNPTRGASGGGRYVLGIFTRTQGTEDIAKETKKAASSSPSPFL